MHSLKKTAARQTKKSANWTDLFVILEIPEILKYELVVQEQPNTSGELHPYELLNSAILVAAYKLLQETTERRAFGRTVALGNIGRIRRVECGPKEDEMAVTVLRELFCTIEPAKCSMYTQRHIGRLRLAFRPLAALE